MHVNVFLFSHRQIPLLSLKKVILSYCPQLKRNVHKRKKNQKRFQRDADKTSYHLLPVKYVAITGNDESRSPALVN